MVSILDIFERNPVSRLPFTQFKNLKSLRKEIILKILRNERSFQKNSQANTEFMDINELVKKQLLQPYKERIFNNKTLHEYLRNIR